MINWTSVGHFFASGFHDIVVAGKAIATLDTKIAPQEGVIESISGLVPVYGPEVQLIERIAFAALGEFAALVQSSGGATQAAAKVQASPQLLTEVENLMKNNPALVKQAANLAGIKNA
jgi:hypothetical protein